MEVDLMRVIALCTHNVYSANHDDPPTLISLVEFKNYIWTCLGDSPTDKLILFINLLLQHMDKPSAPLF